jgi:hypothetical protein
MVGKLMFDQNVWNAGTLYIYILTPMLLRFESSRISGTEDFGGMVRFFTNQEEIDDALGSGRSVESVVSIWWD